MLLTDSLEQEAASSAFEKGVFHFLTCWQLLQSHRSQKKEKGPKLEMVGLGNELAYFFGALGLKNLLEKQVVPVDLTLG